MKYVVAVILLLGEVESDKNRVHVGRGRCRQDFFCVYSCSCALTTVLDGIEGKGTRAIKGHCRDMKLVLQHQARGAGSV